RNDSSSATARNASRCRSSTPSQRPIVTRFPPALSHQSHFVRQTYDDRERKDVTVNERDLLTEEFERHRTHLRAVAYRMLGSPSEADDAVQESWLRLHRSDTAAVANLGAWLTTVVARVALDMLRARRVRREDYLGSWLPEPVVSAE